MNKLALFRIVGESFAKTYETDARAACFFEETAEQLYSNNKHRREWALSNMILFYEQELERIEIIRRLTDAGSPPIGPRINQVLRKKFKG